MSKKAFYGRVSSEDQAERGTIKAQQDFVKSAIKKAGAARRATSFSFEDLEVKPGPWRVDGVGGARAICAAAAISCPPAIPIAVYGEKISKEAVDIMKYYGVENCEVIKRIKE